MYTTHAPKYLVHRKMLSPGVARWKCVLFGSVLACSQAAAFTVLEYSSEQSVRSLRADFPPFSSCDWIRSQLCVLVSSLIYFIVFFSLKLYICVFTPTTLKARKHFQIELYGRNQNSGDSWRVWTRPVREQRDPRWCPRGQTHDSLKSMWYMTMWQRKHNN